MAGLMRGTANSGRRSKYTGENACTATDGTAVCWVGCVGGGGGGGGGEACDCRR